VVVNPAQQFDWNVLDAAFVFSTCSKAQQVFPPVAENLFGIGSAGLIHIL
jgi:hypothetical protein